MAKKLFLLSLAVAAVFALGWWSGKRLRTSDDAGAAATVAGAPARTYPVDSGAGNSRNAAASAIFDSAEPTGASAPVGSTIDSLATASPPLRLPGAAEARLVSPHALRQKEAVQVLASAGFDRFLGELRRDSDSDTLQMTALYRARLQGNLAADKDFSLDRIECGARLCAAVVTAPTEKEVRFSELVSAESAGPKAYVLIPLMLPKRNAAGRFEYRVMFTTDPDANGIEVAP